MFKRVLILLIVIQLAVTSLSQAESKPITGESMAASFVSFFVWPGVGQAMIKQPEKKILGHAMAGIIPIFRFWSAYDALVDRDDGYFDGRI